MKIYTQHEVPNNPTPEQAKKFWETYLKDKKFYNISINKNVRVTKKGIEKCIRGYSGQLSTLRLQLIFIIEYLIQNAIFIRTEEDRKERNNIKFLIMEAKVTIKKQTHNITIRLRETPQGVLYYYHSEMKIKKGE